jgi:3'(2'),5'-bisphosphate nucleotidase
MVQSHQAKWLVPIEIIAKNAGKVLLTYRKKGFSVNRKSNPRDMVTEADIEADALIRESLTRHFRDDRILSEEDASRPSMKGRVWVVDPLDGTDCFVDGGKGFAVIIGLCIDAVPILGTVYIPCLDEFYYGEKGKGAILKKEGEIIRLKVSKTDAIICSRALLHPNEKETTHRIDIPTKWLKRSSGAMDQMRVAKGEADFLININRAAKWDVCASQVIVEEAGGTITTLDNEPIDYASPRAKLPRSYFVSNTKLHRELYESYLRNRC